jgi:homoserine O-acetyltransferase
MLAGASPLPMQKPAADRAGDRRLAGHGPLRRAAWPCGDANDMIYQLAASRTYDPSKDLENITAAMTWVNSADDFINPPEPGHRRARGQAVEDHGKFVLIPATPDKTRGHGTHTWAKFWKKDLVELLARSEKP